MKKQTSLDLDLRRLKNNGAWRKEEAINFFQNDMLKCNTKIRLLPYGNPSSYQGREFGTRIIIDKVMDSGNYVTVGMERSNDSPYDGIYAAIYLISKKTGTCDMVETNCSSGYCYPIDISERGERIDLIIGNILGGNKWDKTRSFYLEENQKRFRGPYLEDELEENTPYRFKEIGSIRWEDSKSKLPKFKKTVSSGSQKLLDYPRWR